MATTRKDVRRAIGNELLEMIVGTALVGINTSKAFTDDSLIDSGASLEDHVGSWVKFIDPAMPYPVARVVSFLPEVGRFDVGRDCVTSLSTLEYEMHSLMSPTDIDRCIDRALAHCWYVEDVEIVPDPDQMQYIIHAESPQQIREVLWRNGSEENEYTFVRESTWEAYANAGEIMLNLVRQPTLSADSDPNVLLIVRVMYPYPALPDDDAATRCPLEWVVVGACSEIYNSLTRSGPADNASRYDLEQKKYAQRFNFLSYRFNPPPVVRIQRPNQGVR
jgi:hypothetical protein